MERMWYSCACAISSWRDVAVEEYGDHCCCVELLVECRDKAASPATRVLFVECLGLWY